MNLHRCKHCGQPMLGFKSSMSDFFDLIQFNCACIVVHTAHGNHFGYEKWVDKTGFVQRTAISFGRYTIDAHTGTAFYPSKPPHTSLTYSAPNIYDAENGFAPYVSAGHARRISGGWTKELPAKDFSGMSMEEVKRWVMMVENFQ